ALALANGLVDLERDARSERRTVAVVLGRRGAWLANVALIAIVAAAALEIAPAVPGPFPGTGDGGRPALDVLDGLRTWGVPLGILSLAIGAAALRAGGPAIRERGW